MDYYFLGIILQKDKLQIDMEKTGRRIKTLCTERNITVKDIQKELYIGAFQSVYDWFSGKTLPSLDNFFRLSKMLKVHMEDMIEVVSEPIIIDWQLWRKREVKLYLAMYHEKILTYIKKIQLQTE